MNTTNNSIIPQAQSIVNAKIEKALKIFADPKNPIEKDTSEHIKSLVTEEVAQNIIDKKLTLKGCLEHCFDKGKKFKVGNAAAIKPEQHFKWCRKYFGIEKGAISNDESTTKPIPKSSKPRKVNNASESTVEQLSLFGV